MGNTNCDHCGHDKKMCTCNDRYVAQEGGDHYQAEYQHWDWVSDARIGYLPGNATKYVCRWRKKNGVADLRKAKTYVDKMIAVRKADPDYVFNHGTDYSVGVSTERFIDCNRMEGPERYIVELLSGPCTLGMLNLAQEHLRSLTQTVQRRHELAAGGRLPKGGADASESLPGRAAGTAARPVVSSASRSAIESGRINHPAPFGYEGDENGS